MRVLTDPILIARRAEELPAPGETTQPDCLICQEPGTFKPSHLGSPLCESGSLASGGWRAHCTCDCCW